MKDYKIEKLPNGEYLVESYVGDYPFIRSVIFRGTKGDWYSGATGQVVHPSWVKYLDGILKLEEWKEIDQSNPA